MISIHRRLVAGLGRMARMISNVREPVRVDLAWVGLIELLEVVEQVEYLGRRCRR